MKKGLKIAAITVGVIIILMFLLPFAFQGKIADIVKTEGNKMLNAQFDFKNLNISLFRNFPQASVTLEDLPDCNVILPQHGVAISLPVGKI